MTTQDFIIELFCRVDDAMKDVSKHPQAKLHPSEVVTLGLLLALKGTSGRAFHRWAQRDLKTLFPGLPERTRLLRLLARHHALTRRFLQAPTLLAICDSYGIELLHPIRQGRSVRQIGKKGKSNWRWIIGAKLCLLLNRHGLIVDWQADTANVHDSAFHPLIQGAGSQSVVLCDAGFCSKSGNPPNLKLCKRGMWNERMKIETVFSLLTGMCHLKKLGHRTWPHLRARLAFVTALFNILVLWNGKPKLAIAQLTL